MLLCMQKSELQVSSPKYSVFLLFLLKDHYCYLLYINILLDTAKLVGGQSWSLPAFTSVKLYVLLPSVICASQYVL